MVSLYKFSKHLKQKAHYNRWTYNRMFPWFFVIFINHLLHLVGCYLLLLLKCSKYMYLSLCTCRCLFGLKFLEIISQKDYLPKGGLRGGATPPDPLLYLIDTPTPKELGILLKKLLSELQKSYSWVCPGSGNFISEQV